MLICLVFLKLATGPAPALESPPSEAMPYRVTGDGQHGNPAGPVSNYVVSNDGLTVSDPQTGLIWQRSPETDGDGKITPKDKLTHSQALKQPGKLNEARFGGFDDWRLPSIKELYSLFDCRGTDPSGPRTADTSRLTPYINTPFFDFVYGDTQAGERIIDSQYASSTKYVGKSPRGGGDKLFGVNFADGRIKGYDLKMPGGREKTFYVQCVRGNPRYGTNDFQDHHDGTVTDRNTGLMWAKADSGKGMNWPDARAWVAEMNARKYLGHSDWRMPTIKELQSIVDYTRSPDTTGSPAIDPLFECTPITNEGGQPDYAFYWSDTTHLSTMGSGSAMYVAFGRAGGWMTPRSPAGGPPSMGGPETDAGDYHFVDVHGAGAQRSDPKTGDPRQFPHGRGPQGDVIRIFNYVRCVRGGPETHGNE